MCCLYINTFFIKTKQNKSLHYFIKNNGKASKIKISILSLRNNSNYTKLYNI